MATTRASDIAREYLRRVQEHYYAKAGMQPARLDDAVLIELHKDWVTKNIESLFPGRDPSSYPDLITQALENFSQELEQRPSPYEDPSWYAMLLRFASDIEAAAGILNLAIKSQPVLGTLPLAAVNARTILIPKLSEHIVILEKGLFLFALLLSKAVARAFPIVESLDGKVEFSLDIDRIKQRVDTDPSIVGRFAEVVVAYATTGDPGSAPQYFLEEPIYQRLSEILRNGMELSVLGHEYGHVIAEHLSGATPKTSLSQGMEPEALGFSWAQEIQADVHGIRLATIAMTEIHGESPELSYAGSELMFTAIDIMDRATSLLAYGDEYLSTIGSHPPPSMRRSMVRAVMMKELEEADRLIAHAEKFEMVVEILWENAAPLLSAIHRRGAYPASRWDVQKTRAPRARFLRQNSGWPQEI